VVLPVTQSVSGAALTLVANAVDSDKAVTITIQDAAGQRVPASVTVKGSPLLGTLSVEAVSGSTCGSSASGGGAGAAAATSATLCSGEDGKAKITLRSANTSPAANRQVRFDVVQGAFDFLVDQAGTVLSKTVTAITDQNGDAIVTLRTNPGVATQIALIRATDLTSGNRVDSSFTVVQATAGVASFTSNPRAYAFFGFYVQSCASGSVDFYIYGGSAPYTAVLSRPDAARLSSATSPTEGATTTVAASGGYVRARVLGGNCSGKTDMFITVTDATGRVLTIGLSNEAGTEPLPVDPPPTALVISPPVRSVQCAPGVVVPFNVVGGTPPYQMSTSRPNTAPPPAQNGTTVSGTTVTIRETILPQPTPVEIAVSVVDGASKVVSAKIVCDR
jgi:hypothetical protein